jgi:hypothetical protein
MKRLPSATILLVLVFFVAAVRLWAQQYQTQTYQPVEITFVSAKAYAHPHRDIKLKAIFTGPSGRKISIAGFWDGDSTYRVRFAPPEAGAWTFRTIASDTTNPGLHHQEGMITTTAYTGQDPFARKGWPAVSANKRYFTHADGTPLFLLGDTALEITWKSTEAEVAAYIADRQAKGFNAVLLAAMSHVYIHPYGVRNQHDEPFALNNDLSYLNPRYFDHLDMIVEQANSAGMAVIIVPLWGWMIEFIATDLGLGTPVTVEQGLLMAQYIGARYAGYNVIWSVAGDWHYEEPRMNQYWADFGRVLQEASGWLHLTSIHTAPYYGSFMFYGADADWLDYYMYTGGHDIVNLGYNWIGAREGYSASPAKPVLNAESNIEDIIHRFWIYHQDTTKWVRIQDIHVREAAYQSVLSGALVGYIYGANGIWQWSTDWLRGHLGPRFTVLGALHFPGSTQMTILKHLMEIYHWYSLAPRQDLLLNAELQTEGLEHVNLPVAASQTHLLAYSPPKTTSATINLCGFSPDAACMWVNPEDGSYLPTRPPLKNGVMTLRPPDENDWLFIMETDTVATDSSKPDPAMTPPADFILLGSSPNPFREKTTIHFATLAAGTFELDVFDLLGRKVSHEKMHVAEGQCNVALSLQSVGLYVYRASMTTFSGKRYRSWGKILKIK